MSSSASSRDRDRLEKKDLEIKLEPEPDLNLDPEPDLNKDPEVAQAVTAVLPPAAHVVIVEWCGEDWKQPHSLGHAAGDRGGWEGREGSPPGKWGYLIPFLPGHYAKRDVLLFLLFVGS